MTINTAKQSAESDSPLLLFECVLPNGDIQRFSSHAIDFDGNHFSARLIKHNLFDFQLSSDDAMDSIAQLSLTLANADSMMSEIGASIGWKGTQVIVYLVFADLGSGQVTTEGTVLFRGVAGDPDEITEDSLKLTFANKLSLLRVGLPEIRIQRLCPWSFPATPAQRAEASGANQFSRYHRCGYSADQPHGRGNLANGSAFTTCGRTREDCQTRGMFGSDLNGSTTSRFGGFEFVPSSSLVRGHGEKVGSTSPVLDNSAKYNDFVPMVYGTGWLHAPVIFARNDGNLTHMEVLLGQGVIDGVLKVVVSDVEIPIGVSGTDMTATGWYNIVTRGEVQGAFNADFSDSAGHPVGDPYGSVSVLSVVVPNRINSGRTLPNVEVLLRGMHMDRYNADGSLRDTIFTNNPAWITLDILRRAGWSLTDLDIASFAQTADFCDALISTTDVHGNAIQVPRFHCNLILTKRKSAAEVLRGIRVSSGLMLRYGADGLLELLPETTIAQQHPNAPNGTNGTELLNDGWPAYEFSDGSGSASGIARDQNGRSTVRVTSRSLAELSNRISVEFQDETNEYQQDSLSVSDESDSILIGREISSVSTALGVPNFNQALRVLSRQLYKFTEGNKFVEFQTSFRALTLRPGDIIAFTYLKEGFQRVPLRVVKLSPSMNFRRVAVLAQIHDDAWYADDPSSGTGNGRQASGLVGSPLPLIGPVFNSYGGTDFTIQEETITRTDGGDTSSLSVAFVQPTVLQSNAPTLPLLDLSPSLSNSEGGLKGGTNYYYAISAKDAGGNEGRLSFAVCAAIPAGTDRNAVTLRALSFPRGTAVFNVYRGSSPQTLFLIAKDQPIASTFTDTGRPSIATGPPDPNFDHANFYYRLEIAGPLASDKFTPMTVGNSDMNATKLVYSGQVVRIIEGTGAGQERRIVTNDETTLTVAPQWAVVPDASSQFVIAESTWRFGALSTTSPVRFEVPNQKGTVVHVSGRSANIHNRESASELCPLTRWVVGGGVGSQLDADVSGAPTYTLAVSGEGNLTLSQVAFADLTNTRSVTAGTLEAVYVDELQIPAATVLAQAVDASMTQISVSSALPDNTPLVQIGSELMTVLGPGSSAGTYVIGRGTFGSVASAHTAGTRVLPLNKRTFVVPFARDFFENPASQNFAHNLHFPDVRVVASEFYVTNSQGTGQATNQCYTASGDGGLRTCSGGQFSLQVGGYLAVQQNAVPPLLVEAPHAVRDIRATVNEAPGATPILLRIWQNSEQVCELTIGAGQTTSNIVDGSTVAPLAGGSTLRLDVVQVGQAWESSPGRDLTVTIRL